MILDLLNTWLQEQRLPRLDNQAQDELVSLLYADPYATQAHYVSVIADYLILHCQNHQQPMPRRLKSHIRDQLFTALHWPQEPITK